MLAGSLVLGVCARMCVCVSVLTFIKINTLNNVIFFLNGWFKSNSVTQTKVDLCVRLRVDVVSCTLDEGGAQR